MSGRIGTCVLLDLASLLCCVPGWIAQRVAIPSALTAVRVVPWTSRWMISPHSGLRLAVAAALGGSRLDPPSSDPPASAKKRPAPFSPKWA